MINRTYYFVAGSAGCLLLVLLLVLVVLMVVPVRLLHPALPPPGLRQGRGRRQGRAGVHPEHGRGGQPGRPAHLWVSWLLTSWFRSGPKPEASSWPQNSH